MPNQELENLGNQKLVSNNEILKQDRENKKNSAQTSTQTPDNKESAKPDSGRTPEELVDYLLDDLLKTVDETEEIINKDKTLDIKDKEKLSVALNKVSFDSNNKESIKKAIVEAKKIQENAVNTAESNLEESLKEGKNIVKKFIIKSLGNTNDFVDVLDKLTDSSYGGNADSYLPSEYQEKLFSRQNGALMAICKLEKKFKIFGTYKRYCNIIVKDYEKTKKINGKEYTKAYNKFIEKSSKLASKYIKNKTGSKVKKMQKLSKINSKNYNSDVRPKYYAMSVCKLALMCLVAAGSKNTNRSNEAKKSFVGIRDALRSIIG